MTDAEIALYRERLLGAKSRRPIPDREDDHRFLRGFNAGIDLALLVLDRTLEKKA